MSRAVLLSTCGDPFITSLCLKLWKEYWYEEIDHLYLNFNNHCGVNDSVVGEFVKTIATEPKITLIYHPTGIGNGPPQVELLKICNESLIMLLEDDGFIFTPGVVNSWFGIIEEGKADIVGSPRYSAGEIGEAMKKKYGLDYSGQGDHGYAWWPNFFVSKKSDLLKTDLNFGSKHYPKDDYFKEFNHIMGECEDTDTGTWMNIQLRYLGLKDFSIPQYHVHPEDTINNFELFKNPTHLHGGSLSSGWGGYLQTPPPGELTDMEKKELETRCAFWNLTADQTIGFDNFKNEYKYGINNLISSCHLNQNRMQDKYNLYKRTMGI